MEGNRGLASGIPARLTSGEGRRFALTVGGAFLGLGALAWWRGRLHVAGVLAAAGGLLVLTGLVVPTRLTPVYRAWMASAERLAKITTPVFLGLLYFVALTPLGLTMRLAGRRPLPRPATGSSGWVPRDVQARRPSEMQHQF